MPDWHYADKAHEQVQEKHAAYLEACAERARRWDGLQASGVSTRRIGSHHGISHEQVVKAIGRVRPPKAEESGAA